MIYDMMRLYAFFSPEATRVGRHIYGILIQEEKMPRIAIIYYSLYGHIRFVSISRVTLLQFKNSCARREEGAEAAGAVVDIFQVPETLPEDVLAKMHAPPK